MISKEFKQQVVDQLKELEKASGLTASRFSVRIGINSSQWSRLKKGDIENVLSDNKFITIAREHSLQIGNKKMWKTVRTATFDYITSLLEMCQQKAISKMLVDYAGIGKTHTAKHYAKNTAGAVYIDCSQTKSKQQFIREIARRFGVNNIGRYNDVYDDLVFYLNTLSDSLIIIDEAGDLKPDAFLELKGLWNATENNVGWFMMGADGLKARINRGVIFKKIGYPEIFDRFDNEFRQVSPDGSDKKAIGTLDDQLNEFKRKQAVLVAKANAPKEVDIQKLIKKSDYSLRKIRNIIQVMNRKSA